MKKSEKSKKLDFIEKSIAFKKIRPGTTFVDKFGAKHTILFVEDYYEDCVFVCFGDTTSGRVMYVSIDENDETIKNQLYFGDVLDFFEMKVVEVMRKLGSSSEGKEYSTDLLGNVLKTLLTFWRDKTEPLSIRSDSVLLDVIVGLIEIVGDGENKNKN